MKKENYYKWNDASISDIEWEQMMGETDFEYPKAFSSLVHFIKSLSEEEEKAFINKIEKLEMENEEERKKQLLNMKSYFIKIGVRCMEDKYTVKEIKQKWISEFCSLLTEEEQKRCHMNQFMWHAFSYKMVGPILKGRLAKEQFDNEKKPDVYMFSENGKQVYHLCLPERFKCYMLRLIYCEDVYFVDPEFRWTFVLPHDYDCIWFAK